MEKNNSHKFIVIITILFLQFSSAQTILFSDDASNYGSWTNGSNAGTGFSAWDIWTQNTDATHFAGHFLGNSVGQGFGDINSSGSSFSMYANPSGTFVQANSQRFLTSTGSPAVAGRQYLLPGQSFKIDMAIAFRNGYKGIDLMDQNFGLLFNFNVGSDIYSTTTNADLGWAYDQTSVFQLQVNQTDTNAYEVIITRGSDVYTSGIRTGQFSGFKLYVGNTAGGSDLHNLHANNLAVQKCAMTTTWNGTSWDKGEPNSNKNVVFTGNYATSTGFNACSVTVTNNAVVTINPTHTLTVDNVVNVDVGSNLIFENNSSLLQTNASAVNVGNITYKRDSAPMRQYEFTYWGSPVASQILNVFSPLTLGDKFYSFNAISNQWAIENQLNVMTPGKGYAIRAPQGYTSTPQTFNGVFIGVPNNGNIVIPVENFATLGSYNFLSNPYPSAISVSSIVDNSSLGSFYFWTHNTPINANVFTADDYAVRTKFIGVAAVSGGASPGAYISAGQGFFAQSNATGNVTFTNSMRVANNNSQFYRNNNANTSLQTDPDFYFMWLNMTNSGGAFKQLALGYLDGATDGFDNGIDAPSAAGTYISFYTLIGTAPYAINGKAYPWDIDDTLAIGYTSTLNGSFDIEIDHFDTFFNDKDVFIEDTSNGTYHNLKISPYTFTTAIGTFDSRFVLHYQDLSLSNDDFAGNEDSVYVFKENNQPKIVSTKSNITSVIVYDMLGRIVLSKDKISTSEVVLSDLIANNQALIIKTTLENNITVAKKFVF